MSDKTYTKQELLDKMESLATISPSEKQTLRDFILKLDKAPQLSYREKVDKIRSILSEIIDITSGSRDYFAIHSCIMTLRMPEDINNPKKLKKVAHDILYKNDDTRIHKQLKELTDRLNAIADMECKPPKKSNIPKLRVYEVTEPEYELLQGFCSYMNDNCDGSYSFYLDIAVLDNHTDTKYTAVMVSDGVNKWQALTPAAYVTVLQGEEYFNLAAHDILDNPNAAVLYNRNCFSDELYDKEAEEADFEL